MRNYDCISSNFSDLATNAITVSNFSLYFHFVSPSVHAHRSTILFNYNTVIDLIDRKISLKNKKGICVRFVSTTVEVHDAINLCAATNTREYSSSCTVVCVTCTTEISCTHCILIFRRCNLQLFTSESKNMYRELGRSYESCFATSH